jgi:hypothetical protein
MRKHEDEVFILSLHVACQRAHQHGFHHTKRALLAMLEREIDQTHHASAPRTAIATLA